MSELPPAATAARLRRLVVPAWIALALWAVTGPLAGLPRFVHGNAIDFVAAYCGTRVAAAGADPYRVEPLRGCEHAVAPGRRGRAEPAVVPAPLPPFTFALLRPIAMLDFPAGRGVWIALLFVALVVAAACAAAVTGVAFSLLLLIFAPTIGALNIYYGEPVPFSIAFIGGAALFATRGQDRLAGICAALALLEPHVGIGACAGAFVALPRTRRTILATGAFLASIGLLELGPAVNFEYLQAALPAQARSEIAANYQLSLTHLLHAAGVGREAALQAGSLWFALMLVLGVGTGTVLTATVGRAAAVYVPVIFTSLGGSYMHTVEIAAAIPGLVLLCLRTGGTCRTIATAGLALLVISWNAAGADVVNVPLALVAVFTAVGVVRIGGRAPLTAAAAVSALLAGYIALMPPAPRFPPAASAAGAGTAPGAIAGDDWALLLAASPRMTVEDPRRWLLKAPQWLGLLLAIGAAVAALPHARRTARSARLRRPAGEAIA